MNVTQLFLISSYIRKDIDNTAIISKVDALIAALANQISTPNEQNNILVSQARAVVDEAINLSEFDRIPRTWRKNLEELGLSELLGYALSEKIADIFQRNQITIVDAKNALQAIRKRIFEFGEHSKKLEASLSYLGFAPDALAPDEAVLSVVIPRLAIQSDLSRLSQDLKKIGGDISFLSEMAGEGRPPVTIKTISTTDPLFILTIGVTTLLLLLTVVEKIQSVIESTYKLRKLKAEAQQTKADAAVIDLLNKQIEREINEGLIDVEKFLFERYASGDKRREKELKIESKKVLVDIARWLDNGYQFDGDAGDVLEAAGSEGETTNEPEVSKRIDVRRKQVGELREISQKIRYRELPEEAVLHLPPSSDESTSNEV